MDGCGKLCSCWIRACSSARVSECIQAVCMIRAYPLSAPFLHAGCYRLVTTGTSFLSTCPGKRIGSLFLSLVDRVSVFAPLSRSSQAFEIRNNRHQNEHIGVVAFVAFGASDPHQCRQPLWRKRELISQLFWGLIGLDSLLGDPSSSCVFYVLCCISSILVMTVPSCDV